MSVRADLILANRAYLDHSEPASSGIVTNSASGGLLAAVRPVIEPWDGNSGSTWIGAGRGPFDREWTDEQGFELLPTRRGPLRHRRLFFDDATWNAHYGSVANSFLWPLLHLVHSRLPATTSYYPAPQSPSAHDWQSHRSVNEAFAGAAAAESGAPSCWIHDYQLGLVPLMLRERGFSGRIGFFLHTPFPDVEIAAPYLEGSSGHAFAEFIAGILGADLVGLQTEADVERLCAAAVSLAGCAPHPSGLLHDGRVVSIAAYPVGIDVDEVLEAASDAAFPGEFEAVRLAGQPLVVGLERADYTKGIPERLRAITRAYERGERFSYLGVAAPTREGVEAYARLEEAIAGAAREAEQAATSAGSNFVHVRSSIPWRSVVALQRQADVVFTSSLADGMNLVPLQAAVAQSLKPLETRAVVITGKDAGVAVAYSGFERDGLVPVDPGDGEEMTSTLIEALAGRPGRVSDRLVDDIRRHDAVNWATRFLSDLEAAPC